MTVPKVPDDIHKFISKLWKKKGAIVQEIHIGHLKGGGAPTPMAMLPRAIIDSFATSEEIAIEIEEKFREHAAFQPGTVRYEVSIYGGTGSEVRPLDSQEFRRPGRGQPIDESIDTSSTGQLTMYMREAHRDRELTVSVLSKQIEGLERRLERQYELIDRLMSKHPELLDMFNRLADTEVEREIRRKQAYRIEGLKDRALQRFDQVFPHIISHLTSGKVNLLAAPTANGGKGNPEMMAEIEPHLVVLINSIASSGERGLKLAEHMTEEEKMQLMAIGAIIEKFKTKEESKIEVKQSNGAEKKDDVGAAAAS